MAHVTTNTRTPHRVHPRVLEGPRFKSLAFPEAGFNRDIDQDLSRQRLWDALTALGRSLGALVIAEGGGRPGEVALCQNADCDAVQGVAVSQPLFAGPLFFLPGHRSPGLLFLPS